MINTTEISTQRVGTQEPEIIQWRIFVNYFFLWISIVILIVIFMETVFSLRGNETFFFSQYERIDKSQKPKILLFIEFLIISSTVIAYFAYDNEQLLPVILQFLLLILQYIIFGMLGEKSIARNKNKIIIYGTLIISIILLLVSIIMYMLVTDEISSESKAKFFSFDILPLFKKQQLRGSDFIITFLLTFIFILLIIWEKDDKTSNTSTETLIMFIIWNFGVFLSYYSKSSILLLMISTFICSCVIYFIITKIFESKYQWILLLIAIAHYFICFLITDNESTLESSGEFKDESINLKTTENNEKSTDDQTKESNENTGTANYKETTDEWDNKTLDFNNEIDTVNNQKPTFNLNDESENIYNHEELIDRLKNAPKNLH